MLELEIDCGRKEHSRKYRFSLCGKPGNSFELNEIS